MCVVPPASIVPGMSLHKTLILLVIVIVIVRDCACIGGYCDCVCMGGYCDCVSMGMSLHKTLISLVIFLLCNCVFLCVWVGILLLSYNLEADCV